MSYRRVNTTATKAEWLEVNARRRGHRFLPPLTTRRKTPELYATEDVALADKLLIAKWFCGNWTWYAAEVDWATGEAFGLVDGLEKEWGGFNLKELEAIRTTNTPIPMVVERDCFWTPTRASEL